MKTLAFGGASLVPLSGAFAGKGDGEMARVRMTRTTIKSPITESDADILRFLAAAEILETDFWQQYTEFASQDGPYTDALENIDDDMPTYVTQNTDDEFSHQSFLNAFLAKSNKKPVNLEAFRTLPGSPVAPLQTPRLTNLMHLNVDTSWYLRYRSSGNPDFGDTFGQAVNITNRPAIPVHAQASYTTTRFRPLQYGGFSFRHDRAGGASLYDALSLKCSSLLALRIVTSIEEAKCALRNLE